MARKNETKGIDIIQISSNSDKGNVFLKIYFSKDKQSLIYKLEPDNIQAYYYYENYYLLDFTQNYKKFKNLNNLKDIYTILKSFKNCNIIEKDNCTIKITLKKNKEEIGTFILRKKTLSQYNFNPLLADKIQENKDKLEMINTSSEKFDNSLNKHNDVIKDIKNKIEKINNNIENILKDITNIKKEVNEKDIINNINNKKNNNIIERKKRNNNNNNKNSKNKEKIDKKGEKNENKFYFLSIPLSNKRIIYDIILVLNIFVILFISYLFMKLFKMDKKRKYDGKIIYDKKYDFIDTLENIDDYDLNFIEYTFDTLYFLNDDGENEDNEDDEEEEAKKIKLNNIDKKYKNVRGNFKEIIQKSKKEKIKGKSKMK